MTRYKLTSTYVVTVERTHDTDYGVGLEQAMHTASQGRPSAELFQTAERRGIRCESVVADLVSDEPAAKS